MCVDVFTDSGLTVCELYSVGTFPARSVVADASYSPDNDPRR